MNVSELSESPATSASQHLATRIAVQTDFRGAEKSHDSDHQFRPPTDANKGRALGVFRQELQASFKTKFRIRIVINQPAYAAVQGDATPRDVATEALGAAKQLVSEAPTSSGKALISFRSKVHQTATYVRETAHSNDDIAAVDDAVAQIDDGLDALASEVAANQKSSASVLEVNSRSKQSSLIRIRTQEGDIVKLRIRQYDSVSARDTATTNGDESTSLTEVKVSSRSRLSLKVEGDLNENELAAIQDVFAQAEEIANQFFDGDIVAAFELAAGFEFDTEQLSRVRLGFRNFQSSNVSYTESTRSVVAPGRAEVDTRVAAAPLSLSRPEPERPAPAAIQAPEASDQTTSAPPAVAESPISVARDVSDKPLPPVVDSSVFAEFFSLISDFLRSIGGGFEAASGSSSTSIRFHYSESFKLEILRSVLQATAPGDATDSASTAALLIDNIAAARDQDSQPA